MFEGRLLIAAAVASALGVALVLTLTNQGASGGEAESIRENPEGIQGEVTSQDKSPEYGDLELATLGGGCFWCIEAVFAQLEGVADVRPGYSGGSADDATYGRVSTGKTGHAEVVQLTFDPEVITYREILEVFFYIHDPTTLNRQGADVGPQYRSVIFCHTEDQGRIAREVINEIDHSRTWDSPVVTQLHPFEAFYEAEEYHDDYYQNNQGQPYCRLVIAPKISKLKEGFGDKLKE